MTSLTNFIAKYFTLNIVFVSERNFCSFNKYFASGLFSISAIPFQFSKRLQQFKFLQKQIAFNHKCHCSSLVQKLKRGWESSVNMQNHIILSMRTQCMGSHWKRVRLVPHSPDLHLSFSRKKYYMSYLSKSSSTFSFVIRLFRVLLTR